MFIYKHIYIYIYIYTGKIVYGSESIHNIELIARFVCSNDCQADRIRIQIRGVAADRWKANGDVVAHSIACCLWRGQPNVTVYTQGLATIARLKYENDVEIGNVLSMTQGMLLDTTFNTCHMLTVTRKKTACKYMKSVADLAKSIQWQLSANVLITLLMALHVRVGKTSWLFNINMDTLLCIINKLVNSKQAGKTRKYFAKS